MYWLYFARDFYRTGQHQSAAVKQPAMMLEPMTVSAMISATENTLASPIANLKKAVEPTPVPAKSKTKRSAKRQQEYVVRSEEDYSPSSQLPASIKASANPLQAYLQRLSIDGEHAFGVWDEENGFSMFSANFDRITGLSSGECAGHDWIHAIHHTQQYAVNEALLAALAGHDGQCLVQARRLKEGAEERWLLMDVKAARSDQHNVMVMFRDLTDQKALEEALKQTESALAMSERSRAAFLSSMSHELRTPLNAIMGFSEMMKSSVFGDLGNPTYKEYAKHIHESGTALLGKINDLLDIASMDSGGLEIEESEFNLTGMLSEAIEMHTHHAFTRQQIIHLDCPLNLNIVADRAKLLYALSHLLTNALRHSKDDGEITLSVRVQQDEGVIISVRDAGDGISHSQLEVIRNAFAAENTYFNIESGGIGLGLSLTKELAARHGGRVMIDSIRHRGTVVSIILPTARVTSGMPQRRKKVTS